VGVETAAVRREPPPTRTTLAFVEVSKDGNREFTFYRSVPAADELLAPEDIRRESLSGASFANFGSIPLIKDPVRSATRKFAHRCPTPAFVDVCLSTSATSPGGAVALIGGYPLFELAQRPPLGRDRGARESDRLIMGACHS